METDSLFELRIEWRSNMFVVATLYVVGGSSCPVRVRNMSRTGALIEAAALPAAGTSIRLGRASLSAAGEIAWATASKAGVRFATPVSVADWLPQGKRGSGQQLIDELVHQTRLGAADMFGSAARHTPQDPAFGDEMSRLRDMLEKAGEQLAMDSAVTARHALALQLIDGVAQRLARMGADYRARELQTSAAS
jgi:hypothetical protein